MSSESGQRLSLEELKQRNQTQAAPAGTLMPEQAPPITKQDLEDLLAAISTLYRLESMNSGRLERLEAGVGAQEALFRTLRQQVGQLPTQEQMAALARDVAEIQTLLQQAGRKREISVSPPSLRTALSVLVWLALLLLGTMVGMVLLQTIWSGLAALWSVVKLLIP